MDHFRNVLIISLALVSYLLLLAWNEDYPPQAAQAVASGQNPSQTSLDLPDADLINADPGADLPQVQASPASVAQGNARSNTLISVSTPVHEVLIDPVGGDIVRLSLPQYPTTLETPDEPFILLRNDNGGVFVSQSGLIGQDGPDAGNAGRPVYSTSQNTYTLDSGELTVDLHYNTTDNVTITKRFIFRADDYLIRVQYLVNNQSQSVWQANLFGQIKRDGSPDPSSVSGIGMRNYLGAALTTPDDPYKKVDFNDMDRGGTTDSVEGGWIAFSQHYFLASWIPDAETTHTFTTRKNRLGEYIMGFVSPAVSVPAQTMQTIEADFWAGPKDQYRLAEIAPDLDLTIDYGWLWFVAQPIFWLLTQINDLFGNYGWSIVGLTIVIKVLFMRLSASSYRSMAKMRRLAPRINQLRDRYGDDKQKLMQAQMELWRKEKVNPLGGCLPMLLQMPVLIGIYWVLMESVELRQAPFILWYDDLSAMDPFFILPLIMGASMFASQLMTPMATADPVQAKVMKFMPVIFTVFFLWFPAGLVLYWLVSNLFNIVQQWYIIRSVERSYENKAA